VRAAASTCAYKALTAGLLSAHPKPVWWLVHVTPPIHAFGPGCFRDLVVEGGAGAKFEFHLHFKPLLVQPVRFCWGGEVGAGLFSSSTSTTGCSWYTRKHCSCTASNHLLPHISECCKAWPLTCRGKLPWYLIARSALQVGFG
jgi:hypothetical protein